MYTIKEAAARSGVTVPLLRAWERRYKVVAPARTASGYRLYDDAALTRLRTMRRLVDEGWSPSNAAAAVLEDRAPVVAIPASLEADLPGAVPAGDMETAADHIERFVDAAGRLDVAAIENVLDAMFAEGTFETVADRYLMPSLVALGEAWAAGRIDVAAEHAASHAVHRRLSAAFQAAGDAGGDHGVLVGLPPGARHELGALAFGVAARRAGLAILYLGPDLPVADWVATARRVGARAAVIGAPTPRDGRAALDVAASLRADDAGLVIAIGGLAAAAAVAGVRDWDGTRPVRLPQGSRAAVAALTDALRDGGQ
ncbi:MAG TPA: MerR family transcriptional regulator [Methylomirabilota bacterium]|nr:MerR family transcriptional regulator [Methylomirabilota bacterium]